MANPQVKPVSQMDLNSKAKLFFSQCWLGKLSKASSLCYL